MRRALGKGLMQLMGEAGEAAPTAIWTDAIRANSQQPRRRFDEESLAELAQSIREVGVLLPLIVRPVSDGRYELIAGERRLRAAKLAGLSEVPVIVRSASAQDSLEIAVVVDSMGIGAAGAGDRFEDQREADQLGGVSALGGGGCPGVARCANALRVE